MALLDERLSAALQRGLPLARRPFEELGREIGCTEAALIDSVKRLRAEGLVRRFGAVFDTRQLGYRSILCAVEVPAKELDDVAARLVPLAGVTHCYERSAKGVKAPNLWFTFSRPTTTFAAELEALRELLKPFLVYALPATRRYKIDVVFGGATRARDESTAALLPPPTALEKRIIGALQGDTEVCADYFARIAARVGMPEWDLLSTLEMWRRQGRLRRIALLVAHRAAGYAANGMCCWHVPGDTHDVGRALAACDEVTHCYERPLVQAFPYNLYAMVHAHTFAEAEAAFAHLCEVSALADGVMLVSGREYKKTSMTFFAGDVV